MKRSKFILNFTPTGMIPTKAMTPHVPVTPEEIVEQVLEAISLGANMVHLHARDSNTGEPTYKKEIYKNIIEGIRKHDCQIILCVSTSGRTYHEFEKRSECLELDGDLKPDMGSLTLSSLNFNKQASVNTPGMIQDLAGKMLDRGIKPELEVFDLGMINYAKYLIQRKLIEPPYYVNFILGNIACAQSDMLHLGLLIKELPERAYWSAGGVGDYQFKTNVMSLIAGGGVRVGLEDNIFYDRHRKKLATNTELLVRIIEVAKILNYKPYKASELRKKLNFELK
ncbi:MAG TPA: 3-keto-5-aminohexanoate cleavage protein [Acidobacteriota bacterium]|nr:3-keto-5-aminohexanoate cleavage protein [Acidobacteriota bacterium]